jgi:hypothetical protein
MISPFVGNGRATMLAAPKKITRESLTKNILKKERLRALNDQRKAKVGNGNGKSASLTRKKHGRRFLYSVHRPGIIKNGLAHITGRTPESHLRGMCRRTPDNPYLGDPNLDRFWTFWAKRPDFRCEVSRQILAENFKHIYPVSGHRRTGSETDMTHKSDVRT